MRLSPRHKSPFGSCSITKILKKARLGHGRVGRKVDLCPELFSCHGITEEETGVSGLTDTRVAPDEALPGQTLVDVLEGNALTDTVGVQVGAQQTQHGLGALPVVPRAATRHRVRRARQLVVLQPVPEGGDAGGGERWRGAPLAFETDT